MKAVEQHKIRNEHIRNTLRLDNPLDIIKQRQAVFIGNVCRMPESRLPRKFLNAWVENPRRASKPFNTLRNSYADTLHCITQCSKHCPLKEWVKLTQCKKEGSILSDRWMQEQHDAENTLDITPYWVSHSGSRSQASADNNQ